jgi:DNA-directed RNA polymerase subunit L
MQLKLFNLWIVNFLISYVFTVFISLLSIFNLHFGFICSCLYIHLFIYFDCIFFYRFSFTAKNNEIKIENEGDTIGNLLRCRLKQHKNVFFAAYRKDLPSDDWIFLFIKKINDIAQNSLSTTSQHKEDLKSDTNVDQCQGIGNCKLEHSEPSPNCNNTTVDKCQGIRNCKLELSEPSPNCNNNNVDKCQGISNCKLEPSKHCKSNNLNVEDMDKIDDAKTYKTIKERIETLQIVVDTFKSLRSTYASIENQIQIQAFSKK